MTSALDKKVDALTKGSQDFATMRSLAPHFERVLRGGRSGALDTWIEDATDTKLVPIMRFARMLHQDIEAVYNAIELT